MDRKDFFKTTACLAGACFCGFSPLGLKAYASETDSDETQMADKKMSLIQNWVSTLLQTIDKDASDDDCRTIMKPCAIAHYNYLEMDKVLAPYIGDIEKFISFISNEWGWKITCDLKNGIIVADENKPYCVCPIVDKVKETRHKALCFCSEGFAEMMFSTVAGHPVKARVISSIQRGNDRCKYEIRLG